LVNKIVDFGKIGIKVV